VTDEKIPDFRTLSFEELMRTDSKDDNDEFNDALWAEQSKRHELLNITPADDFKVVDEYQDEIDKRLKKLEAKFEALTRLIEKSGFVDVPKRSLDQYLEDDLID